jgi:hypothetical protein
MAKVRVLAFILTLLVVGLVGTYVSFYARGYRLNFVSLFTKGEIIFQPNGILVIKSEPDGASVFIDGELKTATNATISIAPGTYDVEVRKDGYFTWYKRLVIEKEVVTQAGVSLFKNVPSLSPVTFSGAQNPVSSEDNGKIAFITPFTKDLPAEKIGLWVMDTFTLPLGFSNEPKRVTDGDLTGAVYQFSPDGRQILLTLSNSIFLLDSGSFVSQSQRVNVASQKTTILAGWEKERKVRNDSHIRNLPPDLTDILQRRTLSFNFSPDEQMILYTASSSGTLPENLVRPLPGASTQKQERNVLPDHTYVYDIKEDRNFLIADQSNQVVRFMPNSRHLLLGQEGQVVVMDYDGTNRQTVYSGSYVAPYAFPYSNSTKLLILTNLGGTNSTPNLYTLTVK